MYTVVQDALGQYNAIFSWLLCLRRLALMMTELWSDLVTLDAELQRHIRSKPSGARHGSAELSTGAGHLAESSDGQAASTRAALGSNALATAQQRLRALQMFRHGAAHLVAALQAYMQGQLLDKCWQQLQETVQVSDIITEFVVPFDSCKTLYR